MRTRVSGFSRAPGFPLGLGDGRAHAPLASVRGDGEGGRPRARPHPRRGLPRLGRRRQRVPRRHRRPLVRERRSRPRGDRGRGRRRSCARSPRITSSATTPTSPRSNWRARVAELSPVPDAAVFFGSGGGEAIDTAAKIVRRYWALVRAARADGDRLAPLRLSRHERLRHLALGDPGRARRLRPARRRRRRGRPRRPGRPRPRPRRARRPRRGLRRRADDRRRRRDPAAGRLLARGRADLPRARRAPDLRRGDLRLRPPRPLVRLRALRLHARPDHVREGDQLRLRAARRRGRERPGARAVLGRVGARRSSTAAPTPAIRARAWRASSTSTSSSASG